MADAKPNQEAGHGEGGKGHGGGHGKGHGGGHGGGHEEGHEGAPEWLISFADNVVLMMGFFVILLAMNMAKQTTGGIGGESKMGANTPSNDMLDWVLGVREAFNNPVDINSTKPEDQGLIRHLIQRRGISDAKDPGIKGRESDSQSIRPSEYHAVGGAILFEDDSAQLSMEAAALAREVAQKIRGLNLIVEVRGHVRAGEAFGHEARAMRLAFDRAEAVANVLAANGVDWWQMRIVTCADNDRRNAHPTGPESDRANARVEVIITDQIMPPREPIIDEPGTSDSPPHEAPSSPAQAAAPQDGGHH